MPEDSSPHTSHSKPCTFYIVRHGQTTANLNKILQGHCDYPLTELGIQQAQELAQQFKSLHFDDVFASDLVRAHRTAEIIASEHNLAVKTTQLLREQTFGKYEARKLDEFREELREAIAWHESLSAEERFKQPLAEGIESYEQITARFLTFLRETALAYPGQCVLVLSHASIMRAVLLHLGFAKEEEFPFESIKNLGYFVLKTDGIEFEITQTQGIDKGGHDTK